MDVGRISTVVIAGSGVTAFSTAAALKRRIPSLDVQIVETPPERGALADRVISTTPSVHGFHKDIGLTEADTIAGAQSGLRAGTLFEGWAEGHPSYVHAYGPYGAPVGGVSFHQLWERQRRIGTVPPFDHFSPAAQLARSGAPPTSANGQIQYGLQLTLERYGALMRDYALHLGVGARDATITEVILRPEDGFIGKAICSDGSEVTADLFIDCTGPSALLLSQIDAQFIDWDKCLPNDRVIMSEAAADTSVVMMDRVSALPFGWGWAASSPQKSSRGMVYSSAHASDDDIEREFGAHAEPIALHQGRRSEFWVRNCVAIGDAAVTAEPLEWTNLHLAHSEIDRLISMMPGRDCARVELSEFNRQCAAEADRVRDFLCLHYVCSRRAEPFWKEAATITLPDSLAHTLSLLAERGRFPYYEEETFTRDSWLAVLFGSGFEPHRIDPLADAVTPAEAEQALTAMQQPLGSFLLPQSPAMPSELNPHGFR